MSTDTNKTLPLLNTTKATGEILGVSDWTVNRLIAQDKLKKVKIGRRVFIRGTDIEEYVNSLTDDPTPIRKSS